MLSVAERHGWPVNGIEITSWSPPNSASIPSTAEPDPRLDLELGETVRMALAEIERVNPVRVVFDSLSEIRVLSQGLPALSPAGAGVEELLSAQ